MLINVVVVVARSIVIDKVDTPEGRVARMGVVVDAVCVLHSIDVI